MNALLLLPLLVATRAETVSGSVALESGQPAKQAVVFFEGSTKSEPLKGVVIDQRDRKFIPHVSVVTVGTEVSFPNHDSIFHNIFSEYHADPFDKGLYPRGQTRNQKFNRPGLTVLLCSIHPDMSAYIMCVDTPYFAITDSKGRFRIPGVPAGAYTVRAWHETGQKRSERMTLKGGDELRLRIAKE